MSSIENYINHQRSYSGHQGSYNDEYRKDMLRSEIQTLNSKISAYGMGSLGDIFSNNIDEADKTLEVIRRFLSQRQKDTELKSDFNNKLKRIQNEKDVLQSSNQKLLKDKSSLQNQVFQLKQKLKTLEKCFKQQTQKMNLEKSKLKQDIASVTNRQSQINNEFRKRDKKIQQYQEKLKKFIYQKQNPKNSFDLVSTIQQNGPSVYFLNAEHQYSQMIQKAHQQTHTRLTNQNNYLRQCLGSMYRELNDILDMRKQMLSRRKQLENQNFDVNGLNLSSFKMDIFNMPLENSKQAIELLDDNLKRFRQQMDKLDMIGTDDKNENDTDKIKTLKNYVVQTQDQMLSKVIMKAKDLKMLENKGLQNRFTRSIEEDEIRNARKFIEDQKGYLNMKQKQLQITRKAMSATIKRVQDEKNQMNKRRAYIQEEGNKLKRQIELLPSITESN